MNEITWNRLISLFLETQGLIDSLSVWASLTELPLKKVTIRINVVSLGKIAPMKLPSCDVPLSDILIGSVSVQNLSSDKLPFADVCCLGLVLCLVALYSAAS